MSGAAFDVVGVGETKAITTQDNQDPARPG